MKSRDDFSQKTKDTLAKRVGYHCSNPNCMRLTIGLKQGQLDSALSLGEAAHITAASEGGPRFDSLLTTNERRSISNGLWLCSTCATLIDRDEQFYTTALLHDWKKIAEKKASDAITIPFLTQIEKNEENFSYTREKSFYMSLNLDNKLSEFKMKMKIHNPTFLLEGSENYEISQGFLTLNDNKRPYEEIEIRRFNLFGNERLDIFGRYFQVIISITNGSPDNYFFGYDINFDNVKRRLTGFENLIPIIKSEKLTFFLPKYNKSIPIIRSNDPTRESLLRKSTGNIELMEKISDIQDYFDITFDLPYSTESETVEKMEIIYNSITGKECLNLIGIPDEEIDFNVLESFVIEKTLLTTKDIITDVIEILDYRFTPKNYYILSGEMAFNPSTQLWEINKSGIAVNCTFRCEKVIQS